MSEIQELTVQHFQGRAKNAVQDFLIRALLVPKIYFDVDWMGWPVDVLAIDRAGSGDVHGVRLLPWRPRGHSPAGYSLQLEGEVANALSNLADFPGQFRYLAIACQELNRKQWRPNSNRALAEYALAPDGVGRTGILYLNAVDENPTVETILKPERFRSTKEIVEYTDKFITDDEHIPNWEVRE